MHRLGEAKCEHNKIAFAWKCLRSVWAVTKGTGFFLYIVLYVLVMWGRQLSSSSMIMPRCRCSWTCSTWLSLRLRLRISGRSWCFWLVESSIFFCFRRMQNHSTFVAPVRYFDYLTELLRIYKPTRQLRSSSDTSILCIPTVRTHSLGQRSFSYAAPAVWNTLPYEIRSSNTTSSFKSSLKT